MLGAIAQGFEQRIAVAYVEWGEASSQEVVVPWTVVDGRESAAAFADALLQAPRHAFGPNAIGNALAAAHALIDANAFDGYRKVIDFSGDSAYSFGGMPVAQARGAALAADIVINGLAILCRAKEYGEHPVDYDLEAAFADTIVGGPAHPRRRRPWLRPFRRGGAPQAPARDRRRARLDQGRRPTFEASLVQR